MLNRDELQAMRSAAENDDWPAVGDAYLSLRESTKDLRALFILDALARQMELRDSARLISLLDQLISVEQDSN